MAKRGRPRKSGLEKFLVLINVICAYNEARRLGMKHSSAVTETVAKVRASFPDIPGFPPVHLSETPVKWILAENQPRGFPDALTVFRISGVELRENLAIYQALAAQAEAQEYPEMFRKVMKEVAEVAAKMKVGFRFGIGPRPQYRRINAKLR